MTSELLTESDQLVKFSRRSIWIALTLLLVLCAYAIIINVFPGSDAAAMANRSAGLLPIAIIITLVAVRSSLNGASTDPSGVAMKAVLNDDLRRLSLNRAYRNGFIAVLFFQPVLVLLLSWTTVSHPVVLMASFTALVGACVVLCSMLAYDR